MLCWFDPAMVAPRLAWLVEAVAFGGADGDVGCGMWDGNFSVYTYTKSRT